MITRRHVLTGLAALSLGPQRALASGPEPVDVRALYEPYTSHEMFTDLALALNGQSIEVEGYMAPPLRAHTDFFIMTGTPMSFCPFCSGGYGWPNDILAVYTNRPIPKIEHPNQRLRITGELRIGTYEDEENGLITEARVLHARYTRV